MGVAAGARGRAGCASREAGSAPEELAVPFGAVVDAHLLAGADASAGAQGARQLGSAPSRALGRRPARARAALAGALGAQLGGASGRVVGHVEQRHEGLLRAPREVDAQRARPEARVRPSELLPAEVGRREGVGPLLAEGAERAVVEGAERGVLLARLLQQHGAPQRRLAQRLFPVHRQRAHNLVRRRQRVDVRRPEALAALPLAVHQHDDQAPAVFVERAESCLRQRGSDRRVLARGSRREDQAAREGEDCRSGSDVA